HGPVHAFDGGDIRVAHRANGGDAGAHGGAVHVHRARSALGDAAAEFGTGHFQLVADHPEERGVRLHIDVLYLSVDFDLHDKFLSPNVLPECCCVAVIVHQSRCGLKYSTTGTALSHAAPYPILKAI